MKTFFVYLIIFFFFSIGTFAQINLVPNPSFEQYDTCPDGLNEMSRCMYWQAFRASPDYFNECSSTYLMNPPNVAWGFEFPHSGNAFAFFGTYVWNKTNYREHLGTQLTTPLVIGTKYYISFYIAKGYTSLYNNIATNRIGALVTTYQYSLPETTTSPLPNASTIEEDSIISDTLIWIKVFGSFIADSVYKYLVIGCFYDDNHIDTLHLHYDVIPQTSGYYLDDVCLSTDSVYCETWTGISEPKNENKIILIYPNPSSGIINIKNNIPIESLQIIDLYGKSVLNYENINNEELQLSLGYLKNGLYYIKVKSQKGYYNSKINIIH